MSACLSVCPSVCLSVCLSVCMFDVYLMSVCLSVCMYVQWTPCPLHAHSRRLAAGSIAGFAGCYEYSYSYEYCSSARPAGAVRKPGSRGTRTNERGSARLFMKLG